jgi:hypothetical protein
MTTEHQRIVTLGDRTYVEGVYSIVNPQLAQTRNNKPYLKCIIRDASGEISARAWSFEEAQFEAMASTGFVFLRGSTQAYQGQVQLIIEQIEAREVTVEEMRALLPSTTKDIDAMFARVCELLRSMEHPAMRALAARSGREAIAFDLPGHGESPAREDVPHTSPSPFDATHERPPRLRARLVLVLLATARSMARATRSPSPARAAPFASTGRATPSRPTWPRASSPTA